MAENEPARHNGRNVLIAAAGVVLLCAVGLLVLHFGQKRHNRLPYSIAERFPEGQTFIRGEIFATTVAEVMDHELGGRTGWRPNDFLLWGPRLWADNNANRQLGIILVVRESVRVFKDHLTKVSSDQYDVNLVAADTAFRNDAERLWLPSAETKYREGVRKLRTYVDGLHVTPPTSKPIQSRNVELIRLFQAWTDLLGDAHAGLYRQPESVWRTDDDFYHAQGVAHAMYYLVQAVDREYRDELMQRPMLETVMQEVAAALGQAAVLKPIMVLDGRSDGIFANHRRNLDAYITEARQKMYSIREELEK